MIGFIVIAIVSGVPMLVGAYFLMYKEEFSPNMWLARGDTGRGDKQVGGHELHTLSPGERRMRR
jgi:hypothetical protein